MKRRILIVSLVATLFLTACATIPIGNLDPVASSLEYYLDHSAEVDSDDIVASFSYISADVAGADYQEAEDYVSRTSGMVNAMRLGLVHSNYPVRLNDKELEVVDRFVRVWGTQVTVFGYSSGQAREDFVSRVGVVIRVIQDLVYDQYLTEEELK